MPTAVVTGRAKIKQIDALPPPHLMTLEQMDAEVKALIEAAELSARRWACDRPGCNGLPHKGWAHKHARASQRTPQGIWETWLLLTGRGWGKTRTAAETVRGWCEGDRPMHIAVIARSTTLAREICFEHRRSGLLAVIPPNLVKKYDKTVGDTKISLTNGTVIRGFGANEPDNLRGWEFDKGWVDEYASYPRKTAQEIMDMLWFCLREADNPQVVISTTPKALEHIKKLVQEAKAWQAENPDGVNPPTVITVGKMQDNRANLSDIAIARLENSYDGTRLGQQELDGELLEDVEGALWKQWMLDTEGFRIPRSAVDILERVVVAVDPAVTSTETADENGFAVMGRGLPRDTIYADTRPRGFLLHSEAKRGTPQQTMRHAAALYREHKADCVVLEANNGGEYLSTVLSMVAPDVNWRIVRASRDKRARATPVAGLYEQGRMHHVGPAKPFDALERVMTTYVGAAESQEKSPDILDALVWAAWDLFLDPQNQQGGITVEDGRLDGRR